MGLRLPTVSDAELAVRGAGHSEAGRVRAVNQDSFFVGAIPRRGFLAVVADGMGGHQAGEIASQKAVEVLRDELARSRAHPPVALARAAQAANADVYNYALAHPEHRGMGTTLTAVVLDDQVGLVGHVGDSRAYLVREGEIRQLTSDHSWVADRVRQGLLTADEARHHRWRNVITNALGATASFRLDVVHFEVQTGDRLVLCSDGVSMLLSEAMLLELIAGLDADEAARRLVAEANERGSPDNVTAVVVDVRDVDVKVKRYALPPVTDAAESVDIGDTMSGIRRIEAEYPVNGPLRKLREHPWYPYRIWILGSMYLLLLFLLFSLWRG